MLSRKITNEVFWSTAGYIFPLPSIRISLSERAMIALLISRYFKALSAPSIVNSQRGFPFGP